MWPAARARKDPQLEELENEQKVRLRGIYEEGGREWQVSLTQDRGAYEPSIAPPPPPHPWEAWGGGGGHVDLLFPIGFPGRGGGGGGGQEKERNGHPGLPENSCFLFSVLPCFRGVSCSEHATHPKAQNQQESREPVFFWKARGGGGGDVRETSLAGDRASGTYPPETFPKKRPCRSRCASLLFLLVERGGKSEGPLPPPRNAPTSGVPAQSPKRPGQGCPKLQLDPRP